MREEDQDIQDIVKRAERIALTAEIIGEESEWEKGATVQLMIGDRENYSRVWLTKEGNSKWVTDTGFGRLTYTTLYSAIKNFGGSDRVRISIITEYDILGNVPAIEAPEQCGEEQ